MSDATDGPADYPRVACPKCGATQPDMDGFGFVHCPACGLCTHPHRTGGVCGICGDRREEAR